MTQTAAPAFRYIGITDECVECQRCGKVELKSTVVLAMLDADGNTEEITYYGSTCAARALNVQGGGRAVLKVAEIQRCVTIDVARRAAQMLARYAGDREEVAIELFRQDRHETLRSASDRFVARRLKWAREQWSAEIAEARLVGF